MGLWSNSDVTFLVEVARPKSTDTDQWDTGLWDDATWGGGSVEWVNITGYVYQVATEEGRQTWLTDFRAGTARFDLNNADGLFSPNYGAADGPGASVNIRPGTLIRLRAAVADLPTVIDEPIPDGTTWLSSLNAAPWYASGSSTTVTRVPDASFVLWQGRVDTVSESYPVGASDSRTTVQASDDLAQLAAFSPPPLLTPTPSGERTDERIVTILDAYGWDGPREVATGLHTLQSSTLDAGYGTEAKVAGDAEGTGLYWEGGVAKFQSRDWFNTRPESQAVQSFPGRGEPGDPVILDATSWWTGNQIVNDVQVGIAADPIVYSRFQSTESRALYGPKSWRRVLENDDQAQADVIGERVLAAFQWDYQRLQRVTVYGYDGPAAASVFGVDMYDLVRVAVPLTLRGWGFTVDTIVFGRSFDIRPDDWSCTWRVDSSLREVPGDAGAYNDGYSEGWL